MAGVGQSGEETRCRTDKVTPLSSYTAGTTNNKTVSFNIFYFLFLFWCQDNHMERGLEYKNCPTKVTRMTLFHRFKFFSIYIEI